MKDKCPACEGTGFNNGKICFCIKTVSPQDTLRDEDVMDFLKGIFNLDKNTGKSE